MVAERTSGQGVVLASYGRGVLVQAGSATLRCGLVGRKLRLVCGDRVNWRRAAAADEASVDTAEARRNVIERIDARGRPEPVAANMGLALSRQQLLHGVWGADWYGDERTVDVHVRQLRRKIAFALERSGSRSDVPTSIPCAARNVLAMPPPITNASTRARRFSNTPTLSATFAPPIAHTNGFTGFTVSLVSAASSASMSKPA